jgi:murein L,D-transpeptidase YafK
MIQILVFSLFFIVLTASPAHARQAAQALADKSDRIVIFYDQQAREIARVPAAFGINPGRKGREGDKRTPEGDYTLAPARPSNQWHWFMPISYPNEDDIARAMNMGRNPQNLGGAIGLHAAGDGFYTRFGKVLAKTGHWGA